MRSLQDSRLHNASLMDHCPNDRWAPSAVFTDFDKKGLIVQKELFSPNSAMILFDALGITNDML